jgi:hypothetical protein
VALTPLVEPHLVAVATRATARAGQPTAYPFGVPPDYLRRAGFTALVIDLIALASIWRSRGHSLKARLVWTAIVALLPVLGAGAWFVLGRQRRRSRSLDA